MLVILWMLLFGTKLTCHFKSFLAFKLLLFCKTPVEGQKHNNLAPAQYVEVKAGAGSKRRTF